MQDKLRILVLEDRVQDAELLVRELRRSGFDFDWERVETEEDFVLRLTPQPHIILADYSMPQFDATRALEILREKNLDIPFIIISGTIGEDAAVAAMKAGANDFFAKNKLTRLAPAIERELREALDRLKRRNTEKQLRQAEERFAKAFQASPVAISISTVAEGRIIDVNETFLRMFGYRQEEVIGQTAFELGTWLDPADQVRAIQQLKDQGVGLRDYEIRVRTKSGEIRDALSSLETVDLDVGPCILELVHDITERKRAETAIRDSEERFRLLAENSTDMIARYTPEGIYLYVSPACYRLLGYQPEELVGHSLYDFFHPDDFESVNKAYLSNPNLLDTYTAVYRLRRKQGDYIWLETTSKVIRGPDTANILEIQSAARDITERKRDEESLRQYNQRLETLHAIDNAILTVQSREIVAYLALQYFKTQESIPEVSIVTLDFEAHEGIVYASPSQSESQPPVGIHIPLDEWHEDDIEALKTGKMQLIDGLASVQHLPPGVAELRRSDLPAWIRMPLIAQNELVGILNLGVKSSSVSTPEFIQVAREIADQMAIAIQQARMDERIRRHAAELEQRVIERTTELEWAKRRVESILNSSSDAIMLADADGLIVQTNPGFYQLFGTESDSALGTSLASLVEADYVVALQATLRQVIQGNQSMRLEVICRHRDGTAIAADMVLAPLPERYRSDHRNVICSVRDITERKRMEEELRLALEKERELNELKTSFVSIVSHEFRTPLTSILSSSQLLKLYRNRMSEERQIDHLDKIEVQVRRLTELLNDVLTLSRAEAIGMDFSPERLNLETFCRNLAEEIQVITKTPHQIVVTKTGECVDFVGDEKLLRQIFMNLLTNAIKYSPDGGTVYFDLACEETKVNIRVKDEGLGIPEDDQKRLFQPFHRAKNVRDIPGTGLGLPIVKRAIEAHGGEIAVESKVGSGTTFIVTLPLFSSKP